MTSKVHCRSGLLIVLDLGEGEPEIATRRAVGFATHARDEGLDVTLVARGGDKARVEKAKHVFRDLIGGDLDAPRIQGVFVADSASTRPPKDSFEPTVGGEKPLAVVAIGASAAVWVSTWVEESPLWLDLFEDPSRVVDREPETGDVYDYWHALARAFDRGDAFSCATQPQAATIHLLLGARGRFTTRDETLAALHILPATLSGGAAGAPGWEAFVRWLGQPRRFRQLYQLPGSEEQQLRNWLEDTVFQLDQIQGSKMWRFWMFTISIRRILAAPKNGFVRWLRWLLTGARESYRQLVGGIRRISRVCWSALVGSGVGIYRAAAMVGTTLALAGRALGKQLGATLRHVRPIPDPAETSPTEPGVRPRVLIVSPYPIFPANHGGGVRLFNLIQRLGRACELYVLVFIRAEDDPPQREALEAYCEKVYFHTWKPRFERPLWDLRPPNALLFSSHRAMLRIRDLIARHSIQVLQLEYTELAQYRQAAGEGVRVILVEHDVAFHSFRRRRKMGFHQRFPDSRVFGSSLLDWARLMDHEIESCRAVDQIHVMSPHDGEFLARYLEDGTQRIRTVPNAVDCDAFQPTGYEDRRSVLFVGNFENLPNLDAFEFFAHEIWPLVRQRIPSVECSVVGAKMPESMLAMDGKNGIRIIGAVPDMRPYYHGHRVLACPIRAGSGTRLKLFEAFASGIPAVATRLAAEGIDYREEIHLLIAEDPETFASALERLLVDDELHKSLASRAMALARERYDWGESAARNLEGIRALTAGHSGPEPAPAVRAVVEASAPEVVAEGTSREIEVSVIIPALNGGEWLARSLEAITDQDFDRPREIICVDSGSRQEDLETMARFGARIHGIRRQDFNHGLTRDLGASLARGKILVFINQDAVPGEKTWLRNLVAPFVDPEVAAVQGGIAEFPHEQPGVRRFFWDSCGERFYFTRESRSWISRFEGVGFSTVNAAIRRRAWKEIPFGWAPIMEDKKWQREVIEAGYRIESRHDAFVYHTHDYDLRSLRRRCQSEGYGWRLLGEEYSVADMLKDMVQPRVLQELLRGMRRRQIHRAAELVFPWYRPYMLFVGNHWGRQVKH